MASSNFTMGNIVPEHKRLDFNIFRRNSVEDVLQTARQKNTLMSSAQSIVNNIAKPNVKSEFKTSNQDNFKWIQPTPFGK